MPERYYQELSLDHFLEQTLEEYQELELFRILNSTVVVAQDTNKNVLGVASQQTSLAKQPEIITSYGQQTVQHIEVTE